MAMTATTMLA